VDENLPILLFQTIQMALIVAGAVVLACVAVPWLVIALVPMSITFYLVRMRFLASGREIKRLESTSKSPIFAAISNGVTGLVTIRTYGISAAEHERVLRLLEASGRAWFAWLLINRWIGVRLDLITFFLLAV
jgi:ATP-binding cassette subfamily C (CFTR/MRP) protein 4